MKIIFCTYYKLCVILLNRINENISNGENMNNIKQVIWDSGYRKNYVAEKLGVHPSHISMWISETRKPSKPRIRMLCKLLGCKVVDLFPEKNDG